MNVFEATGLFKIKIKAYRRSAPPIDLTVVTPERPPHPAPFENLPRFCLLFAVTPDPRDPAVFGDETTKSAIPAPLRVTATRTRKKSNRRLSNTPREFVLLASRSRTCKLHCAFVWSSDQLFCG